MGERRAWEDEYTLLCERCGYVIEGLPTEGACPECGKPIAESLPDRRIHQPSCFKALVRPIQSLDNLRIDGNPLRGLWKRCVIAGVAGWAVVQGSAVITSSLYPTSNAAGGAILLAPLVAPVFAMIFFVLSLIEAKGLRVIGHSRSFRITRQVALWITACGSAGWIITAIGLGIFLSSFAVDVIITYDDYDNSVIAGRPNAAARTTDFVAFFGLAIAIVGFLFFETFAWLGLRRLKYANRVRPAVTPPDA